MLKSIQYIRYVDWNPAINLYTNEYKIIDDDFEWIGLGSGIGRSADVCAIINCYYEKKLPIVINIIKVILSYDKKNGYNIEEHIRLNKRYCPNWHLVEKDFEKYLVLI